MSDDEKVEPTLDQLMAEMSPPKAETSDLKESLEDVVSYVREERETKTAQKDDEDFGKAIEVVKGELDVDPDLVGGWMHQRARKDQKLNEIWLNRDKNPGAWDEAVSSFKQDFQEVWTKPDEDTEAVEAAIKAAATTTPEPADEVPDNIKDLSDAEFERWVASQNTG